MTIMLNHTIVPVRDKVAAARFRNESRWRAIARLDRAVSLRAGSPRARLALALLFLVLGVAAWFMGRDPLELRAQAFAGFSAGCAALGAWAAWRAAGDPPPAVRPLPTSLADHWLARVVPMALLLGGTLVVHAVMPPAIPLVARVGLALSWALPAMLVTLLGLHLGLGLRLGRRLGLLDHLRRWRRRIPELDRHGGGRMALKAHAEEQHGDEREMDQR